MAVYSLACAAGSYALAIADTVTRDLGVTASVGNYPLSGKAAGLVRARTLSAAGGAYAFAIADQVTTSSGGATLSVAPGNYPFAIADQVTTGASGGPYSLALDPANYPLQGGASIAAHEMPVSGGSYPLAIADQVTTETITSGAYILSPDVGNYPLQGSDSIRANVLPLALGSLPLAGKAATLTYSKVGRTLVLTANAGSYVVSGKAANLAHPRTLSCAKGAYPLNGVAAALRHSTYLIATVSNRIFVSGLPVAFRRAMVLRADGANYPLNGGTVNFGTAIARPPAPIVMGDRHVRRSGADYLHAFLDLLPVGQGWPRWPDTTLYKTCAVLAEYWGFVDSRAADLLEIESDPRKTVELLPDWERAWGLPDPCVTEPQGVVARREALLLKMTMLGGQSREFYSGVAQQLGYDITFTEYLPYQCGISRVGDTRWATDNPQDPTRFMWQLGPPELRFYWTVHVNALKLTQFHTGVSECGVDRLLAIVAPEDLECVLERWKPAHTDIVFDLSAVGGTFEIQPAV